MTRFIRKVVSVLVEKLNSFLVKDSPPYRVVTSVLEMKRSISAPQAPRLLGHVTILLEPATTTIDVIHFSRWLLFALK
jgi:hypothetical protein